MNERLMNTGSTAQGDRPRVLCVCSAGLLRSPTVAWVLSNEPYGFNTRAAGSHKEYALIPVDEVLLAWAERLVFVNKENFEEVSRVFNISQKQSLVLDIPDRFQFRDPKLVTIINQQLKKHFMD